MTTQKPLRRCTIVVHGVGQPAPAEVGSLVAHTFGLGTVPPSVVRHDGTAFVEFVSETGSDTILEVNWADLLRPTASIWGVLRHVWYIITSMVDVALARGSDGRSVLVRLYRALVFPVLLGTGAASLATAIAVSINERWLRLLLLVAFIVLLAIATWRLLRFGRCYHLLWSSIAVMFLILLQSLTGPLDARSALVRISLDARDLGFLAAVLAMTLAVVEIWFGRWRGNTDVRCALMALLYLPFIAMNSLMAWGGLLGLSGIAMVGERYTEWEEVAYPPFNLWLFELGATIAFSLLGLLFLVLPAAAFARGRAAEKRTGDYDRQLPAAAARSALATLLRIAPLILIALGIFSGYVMWGTTPTDTRILEVYRLSVLRTLPFLVWFIGPLSIAADIAGDILFYLLPERTHPAAIGKECRRRLAAVYQYAVERYDSVVVIAHSQGSKIAADLRATNELGCPLVTCGSPVTTLYERFLGEHSHSAAHSADWVNGFRSGDPIGGPIPQSSINEGMGTGGHTGYWSDPALRELTERAVGALNSSQFRK